MEKKYIFKDSQGLISKNLQRLDLAIPLIQILGTDRISRDICYKILMGHLMTTWTQFCPTSTWTILTLNIDKYGQKYNCLETPIDLFLSMYLSNDPKVHLF